MSRLFLVLVLLTGAAVRLAAAEPDASAKELPRFPPVEAKEALETFRIKPGFKLELVAAEPLVSDPIAIAFDEMNRMYVVEMRDYPERRGERLGRIRMLEDTDGDGVYDKSTVFVDHLPWPTAVICAQGGIFVGATPDILFCKDTNGDGRADIRQIVFTGFARQFAPYDPQKLNVQELFNSFMWGLDNRIHGASGGNGGLVTGAHLAGGPINLNGRDFSFDPLRQDLRAESDGGQYGLTFDDAGRKFVCSNSSHIRQTLYELRYAEMNRFYTPPPPSIDIAADGPAAPIYRISPDEPWRVLRTKWRVAGLVSGPVEGGGRPSGYFSAATGIMIYRGDAWPEEFRGDAFVADCGGNLVHHMKLWRDDGVGMKAGRPAGEEKVEFLASRDTWFRPVQLANGPDGNLYVIDMYREVIEHPWSLPESIKKHLDLNSGNDRGRIYRIVADGARPRARIPLGRRAPKDWVAALESRNGWTRDTAARLIYERQDRSLARDLRRLLAASSFKWARLHALCALDGLGALARDDVRRGLADPAPEVRWHAVQLCEHLAKNSGGLPKLIVRALERMADDPDPEVREQLAFTAGWLDPPWKNRVLRGIIERDSENPWSRAAVLMAAYGPSADLFVSLAHEALFVAQPGGRLFLNNLGQVIGAEKEAPGIEKVLASLRSFPAGDSLVWAGALESGLKKSGGSLRQFASGPATDQLRSAAEGAFSRESSTVEQKEAAIVLLAEADGARSAARLARGLEPQQPEPVARAAADALVDLGSGGLDQILGEWPRLTPALRVRTIERCMQRPDRTLQLLEAARQGKIQRGDLSVPQRARLRASRSPAIRQLAAEVLGAGPGSESREAVVRRFAPALALAGDAKRGREIFAQRCAPCHALGGQGHALGPDLATAANSGKETILTSILDPSREVNSKFLQYEAQLDDGEELNGIILSENRQSLTLGMPNGIRSEILRRRIRQLRALGKSLMPEGLEEGLSEQAMADLLEYVAHPKGGN